MKIETLNKEAREICQKAYKKQKDHFHNDDFVDDYLQYSKVCCEIHLSLLHVLLMIIAH